MRGRRARRTGEPVRPARRTASKKVKKHAKERYKRGLPGPDGLDDMRFSKLAKKYGMVPEEVERILSGVNWCQICGVSWRKAGKKGLGVDHDHVSGRIRGMLCMKCNSGLGFFRDSTKYLKRAIKYLTMAKLDCKA